jgi:hypothetical protein
MPDLSHQWGSDLSLGPTGDLALAFGLDEGRQRVLRRLLTNPADYLWQPPYGAGLPQKIGQPATVAGIAGLIRGQMGLEPAVARVPEPAIAVAALNNGLSATIAYTDSTTGSAVTLSFDLTP